MKKTLRTLLAAGIFIFPVILTARAQGGAEKGKWVVIHKGVQIEEKQKDGAVTNRMSGVSGLAVDRNTGALFVFVNGAGLQKSADKGKTFETLYAAPADSFAGAANLSIDPEDGKRLALLLARGPCVLTLDGGRNWTKIEKHGDFLAVDWTDPQAQTIYVRNGGHEPYFLTRDQGKTWKEAGWTWVAGIYDSKTLINGDGKTVSRTEDGGAAWTKIGDFTSARYTMMLYKGTGYFPVNEGNTQKLAVLKDKGKVVKTYPIGKGLVAGPYCGKDENHLVLATAQEGFFESADGGQTWKLVAPPALAFPKEWPRNHHIGFACGWDPINDVFYFNVCERGMNLYKYQR